MPEINKAEIYLDKFSRGSGGLETRSAAPRGSSDVKGKIEALKRVLALSRDRAMTKGVGTRSASDDAQLLADAESGLTKIASDGAQATLTPKEEGGLEAVFVTDGSRPSLIIQDDDIDFDDPFNDSTVGTWRGDLEALRPGIRSLVGSVGMFLVNGGTTPAGTGFLIADGLVLTNQHVVQHFIRPNIRDVVIDFAAEFERDRQRRFRVVGEAFASSDAFDDLTLSRPPSKLDAAILRIEGDEARPAPIPILADDSSLLRGFECFALGFPVESDLEAEQALAIFGNQAFGVKRLSPGQIKDGPSTFDDGNKPQPSRVFTHDSSTLRGNSGSLMVEMFADGRHAIGLHFGGLNETGLNYAHALQRLRPLLEQHGATFV
ncbi:putative Protease [uncultured Defluviicoccus sp.]|uniref:Putative Protease n=1 Tax=metagenome TaxID=256318 RepID=A0A380TB75_9ZZZZ|nr:putative Protease [uncultured Defluviicoccus sp.]